MRVLRVLPCYRSLVGRGHGHLFRDLLFTRGRQVGLMSEKQFSEQKHAGDEPQGPEPTRIKKHTSRPTSVLAGLMFDEQPAETKINGNDLATTSAGIDDLEDIYNTRLMKPALVTEAHVTTAGPRTIDARVRRSLGLKPSGDRSSEIMDSSDIITDAETNLAPISEARLAKEGKVLEVYGTPDPTQPISPYPCTGCGALLHCQDPGIPGYLPSQKLFQLTPKLLRETVCQRCYLLEHYNVAVDVSVRREVYAEIVSQISLEHALVVMIIDLTDLPNSIYKQLPKLIGKRRPIYVIGNKVDLLPKDSKGYLNRMRATVQMYMNQLGFSKSHYIQHTALVSAKSGYGIEELITRLMNHWGRKGNVYIVGCTNVGKSTLFNALLGSDYCRSGATDFIHSATVSQWPGTTLSTLKFPIVNPTPVRLYQRVQRLLKQRSENVEEARVQKYNLKETGHLKYATLMGHIGQTFPGLKEQRLSKMEYQGDTAPMFEYDGGEIKSGVSTKWEETRTKLMNSLDDYKEETYKKSQWCIDTPGVVNPEQVINLLTQSELSLLLTQRLIQPRTYQLKRGQVMFVSGLGRIDYIYGDKGGRSIFLTVVASMRLNVHIMMNRKLADAFYRENLGTDVLGLPSGSKEHLRSLPSLVGREFKVEGLTLGESAGDVVLSSLGWVAVTASREETVTLRAYTPGGYGCVLRQPAMLPFAVALRGQKIGQSQAYQVLKPSVF